MDEKKELKDVFQKWAYLMSQVGYVQKDEKVSYGNTKYNAVTESKVLTKIRPLMIELDLIMFPTSGHIHSIQPSPKGTSLITTIEITYHVIDTVSGTMMNITAFGQGADSQDKGAGKAMTYAGKYALLKGLMIETGDDPDKTASAELDDFKDDDPYQPGDAFNEKAQTLLKYVEDNIEDPNQRAEYTNALKDITATKDWDRLNKADKVIRSL